MPKNGWFSTFSYLIIGMVLAGCGVTQEQKPFEIGRGFQGLFDSKDTENRVSAFSEELFNAITKQTGQKFYFTSSIPSTLFYLLDKKEIDGALTFVRPNPKNRSKYVFSKPYFFTGPVLVVDADSTYQHLGDMKNRSVGIKSGYSTIFSLEEYPRINFHSYGSAQEALNDLLAGKIDGSIVDAIPAYQLAKGLYKNKIRIASACLNEQGIRLVGRRGEADAVIELFDKALEELYKNGKYRELAQYWDLFDVKHPQNN